MKERHFAIGGLLLPEVAGWGFGEMDGVILGRPPQGPGRLQILYVGQDALPQPVTHDFCLSVLHNLVRARVDPANRQMMESVCGPYGAATFIRGAAAAEGGRGQ